LLKDSPESWQILFNGFLDVLTVDSDMRLDGIPFDQDVNLQRSQLGWIEV